MTEKVSDSKLDSLKIMISVGIIALSFVAFYYFSEQHVVFRVLAIFAAFGIAFAILLKTEFGRDAWQFTQDTKTEIRKVVWPTRAETIQTTMIVFAVVVVVAIFLWLLDMTLFKAVQLFTGQGG